MPHLDAGKTLALLVANRDTMQPLMRYSISFRSPAEAHSSRTSRAADHSSVAVGRRRSLFASWNGVRTLRSIALGCALLLGAISCSSSTSLPGTDIPDTPDARAVLEAVEKYRLAFVRRDPAGVLALAHPSYFDHAGTDDPSDDVDYAGLAPLLRDRLAQIDSLRFAVDFVSVHFEGDRALVRVWIDASYRMKPVLSPDGVPREQPRFERQQDYAELELIRDGELWRFVRGI